MQDKSTLMCHLHELAVLPQLIDQKFYNFLIKLNHQFFSMHAQKKASN